MSRQRNETLPRHIATRRVARPWETEASPQTPSALALINPKTSISSRLQHRYLSSLGWQGAIKVSLGLGGNTSGAPTGDGRVGEGGSNRSNRPVSSPSDSYPSQSFYLYKSNRKACLSSRSTIWFNVGVLNESAYSSKSCYHLQVRYRSQTSPVSVVLDLYIYPIYVAPPYMCLVLVQVLVLYF